MRKKPFVPWAVISVALVSSVIVAIIAVTAGAADPGEGTVTTDKPMLAWQGEHYDLGQSKLADACLAPGDDVCDHFQLTVDVDPSHWDDTDGGVEVKISWEDEADDFDLWIWDEEGELVGESANGGTSSERVFIDKASGVYNIEVNPYEVTDSAYVGGAHVESRADVPTGGEVPEEPLSGVACSGGMAGPFPCDNVDLEAFLPPDTIGGGELRDIWGWTDPKTGREYAVVTRAGGTSFVDVTAPRAPKYLGDLPSHQSAAGQPVETIWSGWADVKVYKDHAFIGREEPGSGVQVFDLTKLRDAGEGEVFEEDGHYSFLRDGPASFLEQSDPPRETLNPPDNSHNIAINEESGFLYAIGTSTCGGGGPHMIDISEPKSPAFAGCVSEDSYTHDAQCVNYRKDDPDKRFAGREICLNSNEDTLTIVDVTDKENPEQLARVPYDGATYTHQGWLTEDRRHFLLDDELDEQDAGGKTRTYIFNVENLRNPTFVKTHQGVSGSIDHNQYVKGNRTYQANYRSGLRVLDISRVASGILEEVGFFDVYPADDEAEFNGAWSSYPYFDSGTVVVSGIEQGLFVVTPKTGGSKEGGTAAARSKRPRVGKKVRVNRKGRARIKVVCPAQKPTAERSLVYSGARCKGKVKLKLRGKRIARTRFSVPAGERRIYKKKVRRKAAAANAGERRRGKAVIRGKRADRRKARSKQRVKFVFADR